MSLVQEIEVTRLQIIEEVNLKFDQLLQKLENYDVGENASVESGGQTQSGEYESIYPLAVNPGVFKGKKPTGVLFGENGRVDVGTWKMVLQEILQRCNADPEKHVELI